MVRTTQFNLDRISMQHRLSTTHCSLHMCASMLRLMTSNLLIRALVYAIDVCMIACGCTCVYQEHTHQSWIACMQIVSQGQWYKLYDNVIVPRCESPHDIRKMKTLLKNFLL